MSSDFEQTHKSTDAADAVASSDPIFAPKPSAFSNVKLMSADEVTEQQLAKETRAFSIDLFPRPVCCCCVA